VRRHSEPDPIGAILGVERQQLPPRLCEASVIPRLDLQQRQVPQNLVVVLVALQCLWRQRFRFDAGFGKYASLRSRRPD
jgi:hypothetical protein